MTKVPYKAKNFERLLGTPGFSDKLLKNHFKLYEGYVTNTNEILSNVAQASRSEKHRDPRTSELRRRFGWEFNGMRLHEYYFDNLSKDVEKQSALFPRGTALAKKIGESFFSFDNWKKDFTEMGAMRGIGWVALVHDRVEDRLLNVWVNEHDNGHLAGTDVLLIMDVFEHAFLTDYGLEKGKYIAAFWNAIRWSEVQRRFENMKEELLCFGPSQ